MSRADEITKRANFMTNDNSCDLTIENEKFDASFILRCGKEEFIILYDEKNKCCGLNISYGGKEEEFYKHLLESEDVVKFGYETQPVDLCGKCAVLIEDNFFDQRKLRIIEETRLLSIVLLEKDDGLYKMIDFEQTRKGSRYWQFNMRKKSCIYENGIIKGYFN